MADRMGAAFRWIGVLLFGLIGLALAGGGVMLLTLGGSPYYLATGLALLAVAFLVLRQEALAAWLYLAVLVATIIWAVLESGFNVWALMPRITGPAVLGLWFLLPPARRDLSLVGKTMPRVAVALAAASLILLVGSGYTHRFELVARASLAPTTIERSAASWSAYGNTFGGDRFSPAEQITRANVSKLKLAWSFRTGGEASMFEGAPVKIGDALYICTAKGGNPAGCGHG